MHKASDRNIFTGQMFPHELEFSLICMATENESITRRKCGRPLDSKNQKQRKLKTLNEMKNNINIASLITCNEITIGNDDENLGETNK